MWDLFFSIKKLMGRKSLVLDEIPERGSEQDQGLVTVWHC